MGEQFLPKARKSPPTSLMSLRDLHIIETPGEPVSVLTLPKASESHLLLSLSLSKASALPASAGSSVLGCRGEACLDGVRGCHLPLWDCPPCRSFSSSPSTLALRITAGVENKPVPGMSAFRRLKGKELAFKTNLVSK